MPNKVPFNQPIRVSHSKKYAVEVIEGIKNYGENKFINRCEQWFKDELNCEQAFLTPSCTAALEMAAILINVKPGDEIIMPSYAFVSTANAFAIRGAKIVFVDIRPDTMNIDEMLIESAITSKTLAIVPVHYAGVSCDMDVIMTIANKHGLFVIEDAAQGVISRYKGRLLGSIGHFGAYSFHETKNYTSGGEGGLLIINDKEFVSRAEIIREKGTNRTQFLLGHVDKYTWVDIGSSYLMSEIQAACLYAQLEESEVINRDRLASWDIYYDKLNKLAELKMVELPIVPVDCNHNAHMFFIKVVQASDQNKLLDYLKTKNISAVFHYIPLHSSPAGLSISRFHGKDRFTSSGSECIIRLPLWFGMNRSHLNKVVEAIYCYFRSNSKYIDLNL